LEYFQIISRAYEEYVAYLLCEELRSSSSGN